MVIDTQRIGFARGAFVSSVARRHFTLPAFRAMSVPLAIFVAVCIVHSITRDAEFARSLHLVEGRILAAVTGAIVCFLFWSLLRSSARHKVLASATRDLIFFVGSYRSILDATTPRRAPMAGARAR